MVLVLSRPKLCQKCSPKKILPPIQKIIVDDGDHPITQMITIGNVEVGKKAIEGVSLNHLESQH